MIPLRKKATPPPAKKALVIVIADDVEEIQHLVSTWLEEDGHVVVRAGSGREIVRIVRERPVDLVITDVLMPDGDGLDAILALSRVRPTTRILAISGGGRMQPADACLRVAKGVGADAVLLKPFGRPQLLSAVQRTMREDSAR
ncbi:MAG TPA: response regulator [Opitutaceae bacterium]|nr:response regulator [Opitutaceae bacterium]